MKAFVSFSPFLSLIHYSKENIEKSKFPARDRISWTNGRPMKSLKFPATCRLTSLEATRTSFSRKLARFPEKIDSRQRRGHTRTPDSRETDRFRLDRRPPFPSIPSAVLANNTPIEKELLWSETQARHSQGLCRALWRFLREATRDSD